MAGRGARAPGARAGRGAAAPDAGLAAPPELPAAGGRGRCRRGCGRRAAPYRYPIMLCCKRYPACKEELAARSIGMIALYSSHPLPLASSF